MKNTRKILHISNTDIASDSRILKELKVACEIPDTDVSAFGVPESGESGNANLDTAAYRQEALLTRSLSFLPRAMRYFFEMLEFTFRTVLFAKKLRPDILHCHDTFALPSGFIAKTFFGGRLIYDAHELESDKNGQNAILSTVTLWIEKACWKRVDLLVSVSNSIIDWYEKELGSKANALVLNSPEIADTPDKTYSSMFETGYLHQAFSIPASNKVFVYLGILGPGRGIEIISKAFADLDIDAHVVFVGFGPLTSTIKDLSNQESRIHYHDAVPHDQVVPLVRNADFGLCLIENVSLSDYYCLPNKLFEYAFAGLPILASKFPEIERVVAEYSLGVCCDLDVESIRLGIQRMVDGDPSEQSKPLSELSWAAQASRLTAAYENLLRDHAA